MVVHCCLHPGGAGYHTGISKQWVQPGQTSLQNKLSLPPMLVAQYRGCSSCCLCCSSHPQNPSVSFCPQSVPRAVTRGAAKINENAPFHGFHAKRHQGGVGSTKWAFSDVSQTTNHGLPAHLYLHPSPKLRVHPKSQ